MPKSRTDKRPLRLLMVCLGNICRSPTAHGVMHKMIINKGLEAEIEVDSAGTNNYHIGDRPDARAIEAAAERGYDLSVLRARQVEETDFERFDYILAMDRQNLRELKRRCPSGLQYKLHLLLDYGDSEHDAVPDPYYGDERGFELVLDLVEGACAGLLDAIHAEHLSP